MKKNILLISLLLTLMVSCMAQDPKNNPKMNNERLTYFSFDHHNSMALFNGENYHVSTEKDGRIRVVIDESYPNEMEFYITDSTIFDELKAIVDEYKMDKYKSNYQPRMQIFDGDSWSLYYKYDSKRSVSSGGYMAWPDNYHEARQALADYFQKWRNYEIGVKQIDYFKFTSKNNQGRDIEYILERGENEAIITLRDSEHDFNGSLSVSLDYLNELQQLVNTVRLKESMYDYYTSDEEATQCNFLVRYNTGDTVSAVNCYTKYPGHRESAMMNFFSRWLPIRGNLVKFEFCLNRGYRDIKYYVQKEDNVFKLYYYGERNEKGLYDITPEVLPELQKLVESYGFDNAKDEYKGTGAWSIFAFYDSTDRLAVAGNDSEQGERIFEALNEFFAPYLK